MSRMLNLVSFLLERGRTFQYLGRDDDALSILGRLAGLRELPAPVAEETQTRLAEILMRRQKFPKARRHLTAALVQQPANARYHHLLAVALNQGAKADPERAAEHFRKSLELDPNQPECLGEFGLLALCLGQSEEGLASLRRAVELAPDDSEVVGHLIQGLREAGQAEEARAVLTAALFRNPRDAQFRKLWNDFRFHQVRHEQQAANRSPGAAEGEEDGPTLLPYVRPAQDTHAVSPVGKRIRRDRPSPLPPPHVTGPSRLPDRKHA